MLALVDPTITAHDSEVGGQRMHYLEAGNPRLPTLVMVHGRGSAAALWYPIMPLLAPHRHLIAIDMRGWGLSSRAPFTGTTGAEAIAWWRDGVLGIIDALGIRRFDLLGHSLGGMVSLAIALERGSQIDHLALEDAAGFSNTTPLDIRIFFQAGPERLARLIPRSVFDLSRKRLAPLSSDSPALQQAIADYLYSLTTFPGTQASGAYAFNHILTIGGVKYTLRDRVAAIQTPTLALWGTADHVVPLRDSRDGIQSLPHADLVTFPKAGHSPHMETPQPFARALLEFLARGVETPVTIKDGDANASA